MKSKPFIAAFVIVTLAASFSAAFGFWPFGKSATEEWLKSIGLPEGAAYVGEPEIRYEDGNQPEMLLQEVAMEGDPAAVRGALEQRCLAAGMEKPSAADQKIQSNLICMSRESAGSPRVMFDTVCDGVKCRYFLEIHKIGL